MWKKTKVKEDEINLPEVQDTDKASVANIQSLEPERALKHYPENEKNEIINLANNIDVTKIENVMNYGSVIFEKSFEHNGQFLKRKKVF